MDWCYVSSAPPTILIHHKERLTSYNKQKKTKKWIFHSPRIFGFYIFVFLTFPIFWRAKKQNYYWCKSKTEINQCFNYSSFENLGTKFWVANNIMVSKFFLFWRPFLFHLHSPQKFRNFKYTTLQIRVSILWSTYETVEILWRWVSDKKKIILKQWDESMAGKKLIFT